MFHPFKSIEPTILNGYKSRMVMINISYPSDMSPKTKLATVFAIVAIAIVAVIALNPGSSNQSNGHAFPEPIEVGDRDYPVASEAEESYADTIKTLKSSLSDSSLSANDMSESIKVAAEDYLKMRDYYVWMYLDYSKKPTEYADTYAAWTGFVAHIYDDLAITLKESLSGPCAKTVEKAMKICELDPEEYRNYEEITQEDKDFNEKEADLIAEYNNFIDEKQYDKAAETYVKLVQIRNEFAVLKGYDNYSEYAYKIVYGRDYTPAEGKAFTSLTKTAYETYVNVYRATYFDESMSPSKLAWMNNLTLDDFVDAVTPFIDSMSDEYAKLLDYMIENDLIDFCTDDGRKEWTYSADLYTRGSAMIYIGEIGNGFDGQYTAKNLVQEFGHVANVCLNAKYTSCYDVKGFYSLGLASLYCTSGLVGEESSRAMAAYIMQSLLWDNVVVPGLLTELELWAYETEAETHSLTAEQVSEKFESILDAYGIYFDTDYDEKYYWVTVSQLFDSPHSCISYGTSAIGAIELFVEATENYDAAKEKYLDLVFQQDINGYSEAAKKAGLTNAFDTDAVKAILDKCVSALDKVKA